MLQRDFLRRTEKEPPQGMRDSATGAQDELSLAQILRTLWRGKWMIAIAAVLALGVGRWYVATLTPIYSASASVALMNTRSQSVTDFEGVIGGLSADQRAINTEMEVMRSRELMERVVNSLDLTSSSEFNARLAPPDAPTLAKAPRAWMTELIFGGEDAALAPVEADPAAEFERAVNAVRNRFSVNDVARSFVFQITARSPDPVMAAELANALANGYVQDQIDLKFNATAQATEWLSARVSQLRDELQASEQELKTFMASTDLVSAEALDALNRRLKDLRDRASDAEAAVTPADLRLQELTEARASGDLGLMSEVARDRTLDRIIRDGVDQLSSNERATFMARYDQIIAGLEAAKIRDEAQARSISASVVELEAQIIDQSDDLVTQEQLRREVEANRLIYESFLTRLKEISVQQGAQQADSRVLSEAIVPRAPTSPNASRIQLLAIFVGLVAGAGLVLGREILQNTYRTAEDLERQAGLTVMGQIPMIPASKRNRVLEYILEKPNSPAAEAIRNLRTSLILSNVDKPPQIIMSTSSVPGEGKTTISLTLAQNSAELGKRVLLIEGDIRRRVFSEYFDMDRERGLLAVLSGSAELDDVVEYSPKLRCDILIGEKSKVNAADIFSSAAFEAFLTKCRDLYDVIIIDTPPVLVVPDARVIGQSCDMILYSVKWDSTSRTQVTEGLRLFESVNLNVHGFVLNQINPQRMKAYGYGERYGAYAAYGNKYYTS